MKPAFSPFLIFSVFLATSLSSFAQTQPFKWPKGARMAISLTFDDGRGSQASKGAPVLDEYDVKGTFYVVPSAVKEQLEGWRKVVAKGHEIGNHSLHHSCSGNFVWSRKSALENYTIAQMWAELLEANMQIEALLGVKAESYAYPCGQTFVGRGKNTQSFVPVIAEIFASGRTWLDEAPADPTYCDMAQLTGIEMDGKDFEQILPIIEEARKSGQWLILAGHETNDSGYQTTRLALLRKLCEYAKDPANGIWMAPVGEVARYVKMERKSMGLPE